MTISSLGYARISLQNPQDWAQVGEEVLGFESSTDEDGSVRLRMDESPFRYLVEKSETEGFVCAGWECPAEKFDEIVNLLDNFGALIGSGDKSACAARAVGAFVTAKDPSGNLLEVFHSRDSDQPFASPLGLDYVAGDLGLGHAVLPASAHDETSEFYNTVLGFNLSDQLVLPPPAEDMQEMRINFYHADNPRHHSLALFNGPAPSGVVHLMTEMTSIDAVGSCMDRVNAAGIPITATLGRHINDGMVSFYFLAPGAIPMEVGYDGMLHDWSDFVPTQSTVGDHWGHVYNFPE